MQFKLYGKVLERTVRKVQKKDGSVYDLYQIVIEEPGLYPSQFALESKLASLFGPADGPLGVGKFVTATGFVNGYRREVPRKDGSGKFVKFETRLTLKSLDPQGSAADAVANSTQPDEVSDDMPF